MCRVVGFNLLSQMQRAVSSGRFQQLVSKLAPQVKTISALELSKSTPLLLDVRETYEWNEQHIPSAVYTGRGCLERDIEGLVPDLKEKIVLYCAAGHRSVVAAHTLQQMGYGNVFSLKGGLQAWKDEGLPLQNNLETFSARLQSLSE